MTNLIYLSGEVIAQDGELFTMVHDTETGPEYYTVKGRGPVGENVVVEGSLRTMQEEFEGYLVSKTYILAKKIEVIR